MNMNAQILIITPEKAAEMLSVLGTHNRNLKPGQVKQLAADMKVTNWDPINVMELMGKIKLAMHQ